MLALSNVLGLVVFLQLSSLGEEVAVKGSDLAHATSALQEHKESLAHLRAQLDRQQQQSKGQLEAAYHLLHTAQDNAAVQLKQVQDSLGAQLRQLQLELAATSEAKQQAQATVMQLQQEGRWGLPQAWS